MDLRHLRCFLAVAEELHFSRAAERLHIEQSPLSRTIRELEGELGASLFARSARGTRLTQAGERFLEHVPRVFAALEQARASVQDVAAGFRGQLRIALSDGLTPARLSTLMALCREEDPSIAIHCSEMSLSQQISGLHEDLYDLGFAQSAQAGDGILATPAWHDPLQVILPARHALLAFPRIPLGEVLRYPLVFGDPRHCEGYCRQVEHLLRRVDVEPQVAERVKSVDLMLTLVSAGYAVALVGASQIAGNRELGVVVRPLAEQMVLTTWLLRPAAEPGDSVVRFIQRVESLRSPTESHAES